MLIVATGVEGTNASSFFLIDKYALPELPLFNSITSRVLYISI